MSTCMMTVDVEDWFHANNVREVLPRETWDELEWRVDRSTRRVLELFAEHGVTATFFMLGWVAERAPELVDEIHGAGHEIASHGYAHRLAYAHTADELRRDLRRSRNHLESVTGGEVIGYRAPNFSVDDAVIDVIAEEGFVYDSSYFPSFLHDRYGSLDRANAADGIVDLGPLTEVAIPTLRMLGKRLPWGGGGYFRAMPYPLFRWGVRRILRDRGHFTFYMHPWELDVGQPRLDGLSPFRSFRHYVGMERTEARLRRLLSDFEFVSIREGLEGLS